MKHLYLYILGSITYIVLRTCQAEVLSENMREVTAQPKSNLHSDIMQSNALDLLASQSHSISTTFILKEGAKLLMEMGL